jgi:hypothetical protein
MIAMPPIPINHFRFEPSPPSVIGERMLRHAGDYLMGEYVEAYMQGGMLEFETAAGSQLAYTLQIINTLRDAITAGWPDSLPPHTMQQRGGEVV